uniref:Uncharacterized protein n=1 Tax=Utricularia reniformis TaxID=192314 RepID=A0A1Y0B2L6_9LAMI|nr:hypothetical protein AEK19_MT1446 [Utricularia reniformis]ART31638.1 hypothetical protein AEK19_MT1446 [Utricularia reniformis]
MFYSVIVLNALFLLPCHFFMFQESVFLLSMKPKEKKPSAFL